MSTGNHPFRLKEDEERTEFNSADLQKLCSDMEEDNDESSVRDMVEDDDESSTDTEKTLPGDTPAEEIAYQMRKRQEKKERKEKERKEKTRRKERRDVEQEDKTSPPSVNSQARMKLPCPNNDDVNVRMRRRKNADSLSDTEIQEADENDEGEENHDEERETVRVEVGAAKTSSRRRKSINSADTEIVEDPDESESSAHDDEAAGGGCSSMRRLRSPGITHNSKRRKSAQSADTLLLSDSDQDEEEDTGTMEEGRNANGKKRGAGTWMEKKQQRLPARVRENNSIKRRKIEQSGGDGILYADIESDEDERNGGKKKKKTRRRSIQSADTIEWSGSDDCDQWDLDNMNEEEETWRRKQRNGSVNNSDNNNHGWKGRLRTTPVGEDAVGMPTPSSGSSSACAQKFPGAARTCSRGEKRRASRQKCDPIHTSDEGMPLVPTLGMMRQFSESEWVATMQAHAYWQDLEGLTEIVKQLRNLRWNQCSIYAGKAMYRQITNYVARQRNKKKKEEKGNNSSSNSTTTATTTATTTNTTLEDEEDGEMEVYNLMRMLFDVADADVHSKSRRLKRTCLSLACEHGLLRIVGLLVSKGAQVNEGDMRGNTSLHYSSYRGHPSIVRELLQFRGIDIHARNAQGDSMLHFAARGGCVKTCKLLLEAGVNVNVRNKWQRTCLSSAAKHGHNGIVRLLIKYKVDLDVADLWGLTSLHNATMGDKVSTVEYLIRAGANVNLCDSIKRTCLDLALRDGFEEIARMLVEAGGKTRQELKELKECSRTPKVNSGQKSR